MVRYVSPPRALMASAMIALALLAFSSASWLAWGLPALGAAGCDGGLACVAEPCVWPTLYAKAKHTSAIIGKNCFIPLEGLSCNQDCSVFCGLSARSEYCSFASLDARNARNANCGAIFSGGRQGSSRPKPRPH